MLKITLSTGEIVEYNDTIENTLYFIKQQLFICERSSKFLIEPITIISYHYELHI